MEPPTDVQLLLQPLCGHNFHKEYHYQLKNIADFERLYDLLERNLSTCYSELVSLEEELNRQKNETMTSFYKRKSVT